MPKDNYHNDTLPHRSLNYTSGEFKQVWSRKGLHSDIILLLLCVICCTYKLGKLLTSSMLQFPHLQNGDNSNL